MSKSAIAISVLVGAAGAVAIYFQQTENQRLRSEIAEMRDELHQASQRPAVAVPPAPAAGANDSLAALSAADRTELAKLRDEIGGLKKTTQELARLAQNAAPANKTDSIPTNLVPLASWKNAGKATAGAALETVLWAAAGGEVDAVADAITFSATARQKADEMWAQLSEATRAQYGTPEKLIGLLIAKDAATVSGMQVLGQRDMTPDDVGMRLRFGSDDGKTKDDSFLLHRGSDGAWRLMLTDAAVDKFSKQVLGTGK